MQGFNMGRYVPPDQEGLTSGNALHNKRAPGMHSKGQQTVRFEMPFPIWCSTCPKPTVIGQGVRFNAVKTRAGSYFSSPIFSFRMRHPACGGEIEIKTDPKNTAYVVVSGARKRDIGNDEESLVKVGKEGQVIVTEEERRDARDAAFRNLEKTIEDREVAKRGKLRIDELLDKSEKSWDDPYERNRRLRKEFRVGRKGRERDAVRTGEIKGRLGLGEEFELMPEREEDGIRARLVEFGRDRDEQKVDKALMKPLFDKSTKTDHSDDDKGETAKVKEKKLLRSEMAAAKMREGLVSEIVGNTRAARDPFLEFGTNNHSRSPTPLLPGLKRKRPTQDGPGPLVDGEVKPEVAVPPLPSPRATTATCLVSYDSD